MKSALHNIVLKCLLLMCGLQILVAGSRQRATVCPKTLHHQRPNIQDLCYAYKPLAADAKHALQDFKYLVPLVRL